MLDLAMTSWRGILEIILTTIQQNISDFTDIGSGKERELQDLLYYRLADKGLNVKRRVILERPGFPRIEIDVLIENCVAVEIKCDRRFYEGIGQILAVMELYGKFGVLLHLVDDYCESEIHSLKTLANKYGFSVIIIMRHKGDVVTYW